MNSIGEDCNELKKQYDACFNSWFSERFLKGHTDESACAPIFRVYQDCVKRAMREQKIELREIGTEYTTNSEYEKTGSSSGKQQSKS
ncbi:TP53-regulated inhibitor of apoptosis 1-like [Drosophila miranda]|uniref:TP53-regulated inhibitor of apoptosis 1-like n=1 Tax=Drosophila miranda TaxID=7229 RepID=UPI0007E7DB17|nr:TP53-regulated inhibitor of apoptosis 1-like [Drosophila miranda]